MNRGQPKTSRTASAQSEGARLLAVAAADAGGQRGLARLLEKNVGTIARWLGGAVPDAASRSLLLERLGIASGAWECVPSPALPAPRRRNRSGSSTAIVKPDPASELSRIAEMQRVRLEQARSIEMTEGRILAETSTIARSYQRTLEALRSAEPAADGASADVPPPEAEPAAETSPLGPSISEIESWLTALAAIRSDPRASSASKVAAASTSRGLIELRAKLEGDLSAISEARIVKHPAFRRAAAAIVDALTPFPEALAAARAAVLRLDHEEAPR